MSGSLRLGTVVLKSVDIRSPQAASGRGKSRKAANTRQIAYSCEFEADIFSMFHFMNQIENNQVLCLLNRQYGKPVRLGLMLGIGPTYGLHRVSLNIITYVYNDGVSNEYASLFQRLGAMVCAAMLSSNALAEDVAGGTTPAEETVNTQTSRARRCSKHLSTQGRRGFVFNPPPLEEGVMFMTFEDKQAELEIDRLKRIRELKSVALIL